MPSGSDSAERARADLLSEEYVKKQKERAEEYAKNQKERELSIARLEIRAEMRSSTDEEENSAVIDQRVLEAQKRGDLPVVESDAPAKVTVWNVTYSAVKRVPPWGIVILGVVCAVCYTVMRLAGVIKWP